MEGSPPTLSPRALLSFAYVAPIATALAFAAWFTGLRHPPTATGGLIGLLGPVTGVLLGTAVAGETLRGRQRCGLLPVSIGVVLGRPGRANRRDGDRAEAAGVTDRERKPSPAAARSAAGRLP